MAAAKKAKNDEFYTHLSDIENEVKHYRDQFKDKVIYLNCDDAEWSNFFVYFKMNFHHLGIKKLIATHYLEEGTCYKWVIDRDVDVNGDGIVNEKDLKRTALLQNGDFRSDECVEILKEADIVVTNPPFSLFREFIALLMQEGKKFLIIGNASSFVNKEIFPLVIDNSMWMGVSPRSMEFLLPDDSKVKVNACWFTNLEHNNRTQEVILYKKYTPEEYPNYDNYDAINVDKVKNIPADYSGVMGVPITFLGKHNPNQFEIVWQAAGNTRVSAPKEVLDELGYTKHSKDRGGCPVLDGETKFTRLLIRRR